MPQAAIPIAAEAAVASTMTAAEIAAAEAAAAAAAEAAAVAAAEQAAAAAATEAATTAAAEQAATQAATQAAAQTATPTGLEQLLQPTTAPVTSPAPVQTAPVQPAFNPPPAAQPSVAPPAPVAPPPPAPPPVQEVIPRSQGFIDTTTRMANPGFDAGGFENLSGIETLAKEVGAQTPNMQGMQGMQTMTSGYGAPAPPGSSVLPSMPVGSPPAPGIDQLVQPNLSNMGANIPPAPVMPPPAAPPIEPGGMPRFPTQTTTEPLPNGGPQMRDAMGGQPTPFEYVNNTAYGSSLTGTPTTPPEVGGLQGLYNDFKAMPLKDKALTGMMASSAYQMMNQPKPYEPKKYKSTFNSGAYSGYQPVQPTPYRPNYAHGGLADLGGYSDYARGGRMLKGPGDGMSDDIPATIANKQPARLANEEFVIPADVVSHLGNGSSEAGAKQLYKMMDRVRKARTGNKKQGKQINPEKYLA